MKKFASTTKSKFFCLLVLFFCFCRFAENKLKPIGMLYSIDAVCHRETIDIYSNSISLRVCNCNIAYRTLVNVVFVCMRPASSTSDKIENRYQKRSHKLLYEQNIHTDILMCAQGSSKDEIQRIWVRQMSSKPKSGYIADHAIWPIVLIGQRCI